MYVYIYKSDVDNTSINPTSYCLILQSVIVHVQYIVYDIVP